MELGNNQVSLTTSHRDVLCHLFISDSDNFCLFANVQSYETALAVDQMTNWNHQDSRQSGGCNIITKVV